MLEENKAVVRRFVEEIQNKHNLDAIDNLHSPDFVNRSAIEGFSPEKKRKTFTRENEYPAHE